MSRPKSRSGESTEVFARQGGFASAGGKFIKSTTEFINRLLGGEDGRRPGEGFYSKGFLTFIFLPQAGCPWLLGRVCGTALLLLRAVAGLCFALTGLAHGATAKSLVLPAQTVIHHFDLKTQQVVVLGFDAALQNGGWGTAGQESAVLLVTLDGRPFSQVVVTHTRPMPQRVLLGQLAKGPHRVVLQIDKNLSRNQGGVVVSSLAHQLLAAGSPDEKAALSAPFLQIENWRTQSDLPVLLAWRNHGAELSYEVIFTNEDGGTGRFPGLLMGMYGRMVDTERALWQQGGGWYFQGSNHSTRPAEVKAGERPTLSVCTDNGMFCPLSPSMLLRLSLPPVAAPEGPLERLLDIHPWITRLMTEEALREKDSSGKPKTLLPHDTAKAVLGHPLGYLYLDLGCEGPPGGKVGAVARLADGKVYKSLNVSGLWVNASQLASGCGGVMRKVIKLPMGVNREDIAALGVVNVSKVAVTGIIRRALLLDENFRPVFLPPAKVGQAIVPAGETVWLGQ